MRTLSETTPDRAIHVGPLSGVVGVILFLVGSLLPGLAPSQDASTSEVVSFLVDQRSLILLGTAIALLSLPCFGVFIGSFRSAMGDRARSDATLTTATVVGWALLIATVTVGFLALTAITWRGADHLDASTVQFGYDTSVLALYAVSAPAAALAVGGASVFILRTGLVPAWIAYLGLLEVAINVTELLGLTASTAFDAARDVAGIGPLVWGVWVVAFAIALARRT